MQLANNPDFEAWSISDWEESGDYEPGLPTPQWTEKLKEDWSKNLTKPEDFSWPIHSLVWWRSGYGLEDMIIYRRRLDQPQFPPDLWEECSPKTQDLAEVYSDYIIDNCCDDRPHNFYPLLDRIVEWMDTFYGAESDASI